ncbi:hypothetical protein [Caulobacter sp.]|uniref:hypothetical protein n=1 Tax=Caulobacter sp. TaxID=78 RepID=UPI003BAF7041
MSQENLWSLSPAETAEDEFETVFLGVKTGDQIVRDAVENFSRDLNQIYERQNEKVRQARRRAEAA